MPDTRWSQNTHCFVVIAEFFRNCCLRTRLSNFDSVERVRLWSGVSSSICFVCLCSLIWDRYLSFSTAIIAFLQLLSLTYVHSSLCTSHSAFSIIGGYFLVNFMWSSLLFRTLMIVWYFLLSFIVLIVLYFDSCQGIPCDDKVRLFFLISPPALQSNDSRLFDHLQNYSFIYRTWHWA